MIDHKSINRPLPRLQLQPKLLLNRSKDRRPRALGRRIAMWLATGRRRSHTLSLIRRPVQLQVIFTGKPRLVDNGAMELLRQYVHDRRHWHPLRSKLAPAHSHHASASDTTTPLDSIRVRVPRPRLLQLWAALRDNKLIDRKLLRFGVDLQLEPVCEEGLEYQSALFKTEFFQCFN